MSIGLRAKRRMCGIVVALPLALVVRAHANDVGGNRLGAAQDYVDQLVDRVVENNDMLNLDATMLGKPSALAMPSESRFAPYRSPTRPAGGIGAGQGPGRMVQTLASSKLAPSLEDKAKRAADEAQLPSRSRRNAFWQAGAAAAAILGGAGRAEAGPKVKSEVELAALRQAGLEGDPRSESESEFTADPAQERLPGSQANVGIRPEFNNSKCPSFDELRSSRVEKDFDIKRDLPGFYYELAFHDTTQYPLCPTEARCVTSSKTVTTHNDGVPFVKDDWNLQCFNGFYPQTLQMNITKEPGNLLSYWDATEIPLLPKDLFSRVVFPNTVVDYKTGPEGWVLEFQCVDTELFGVVFIGINFYSKVLSEKNFNEMYAAGQARGIDFYWKQGLGLTRVQQNNCPPPPQLKYAN
eukprot:gnl/TRDRNA2_/TRDRNA2_125256_c0_seq1.p1 gnl/TRDRNA2_/TRDRNA2_125256_c0~~gnl/TRDRNA2_/TRDRNA2_125256_c0_seq1.p1  ORF type:complete len:409 (+),score=52.49 gnl/TRDRNA2_/TRDRNA2_125256_c0_seq1:94-1320(+)